MSIINTLMHMSACYEAQVWAIGRVKANADLTWEQLWNQCERGDWLLWYAARINVDRKLIVLAACDCAEVALKHVPEGEERPRQAIETARRWCSGEASIQEVRAADAAAAYADAAVAYAADAVAYADAAVAYAADAVAHAESLKHSAELVRARIPWSTVAPLLERYQEMGGLT